MADTETKSKAEKEPQKSDKAPRPEKGDKAQQAQKGPKPEKGDKAAKGEAPPPKPRRREERVTPRLKTYFEDVVRKKLFDELGYKSRLQVPVIEKVVINMGIGEGVADRKKVEQAAADLGLIAGQKAVITKARKSIATFKVRDGQAIGCKVTLRKSRMYEFMDRLIKDPDGLSTLKHLEYVREAGAEGIELVMWLIARGAMADVVSGGPKPKVAHRFYHVPASNTAVGHLILENN